LDQTKWKKILAEAIKEAYSDIFVIKSKPTKSDLDVLAGKYKSTYNMSELAAERAARTFLALLTLADEDTLHKTDKLSESIEQQPALLLNATPGMPERPVDGRTITELHYNIQIHLPATKDVEVYNAIFKSLRGHLID
jgi:hypothetical protein